MQSSNFYDVVIIGTSPIFMIEAIYQSNMGKKVLMVDEENSVGGAWKSLNIFNFKDVENAIHYLLPNKKAIKF